MKPATPQRGSSQGPGTEVGIGIESHSFSRTSVMVPSGGRGLSSAASSSMSTAATKLEGCYGLSFETPPSSAKAVSRAGNYLSYPLQVVDDVVGPNTHFVYNPDLEDDGKVFDGRTSRQQLDLGSSPNHIRKVRQAAKLANSNTFEMPVFRSHPFESALYPQVFSSTTHSSSSKRSWHDQQSDHLTNGKLSFAEHCRGHSQSESDVIGTNSLTSRDQVDITEFAKSGSRNVKALVTPRRRDYVPVTGVESQSYDATAFVTPTRQSKPISRLATLEPLEERPRSMEAQHSRTSKAMHTCYVPDSYPQNQVIETSTGIVTHEDVVSRDSRIFINGEELTDNNAQKMLPTEYCLFVGNLPLFNSTDEIKAKLKALVGSFAPVFIQTHQDSSGRPYAHLQFTTLENKTGFFDYHTENHLMIDGRALRLEETKAPRSVYVRTLDGSDIDIDEVKKYLHSVGGTMIDAYLPNLSEVVGGSFSRADGLVFKFKNYGEYLQVRKALKNKRNAMYEFLFTPQQMAQRSQPNGKLGNGRAPCLVFVGNLDPMFISEERLRAFLGHWGRLNHIEIVANPHCRLANPTEPASVHAWVEFLNLSDAYTAIEQASGMFFFGRQICVQPHSATSNLSSFIDRMLNMLYCVAPSPEAVTQTPGPGFMFGGRFYPF